MTTVRCINNIYGLLLSFIGVIGSIHIVAYGIDIVDSDFVLMGGLLCLISTVWLLMVLKSIAINGWVWG